MNVLSRPRVRNALIAVLVLAVIGVAVAWFLHAYHRVEREFPLPPHGEAGYNPLYALKRTLQEEGLQVDSRQRLDLAARALAPGDTFLIYNDPRGITPAQARQLLAWVEQGGHLLVRTPPATREPALPPLLEQLGVRLPGKGSWCEPFQVEGEGQHVEFCNGQRFTLDGARPLLTWGDLQAGYVYVRLPHGRGHVDVLADFDFLANTEQTSGNPLLAGLGQEQAGGLRDGSHRALARQLLAPNHGEGTMHLAYAAQMPSLMRIILTRGWPVWLPLLLALFAWLWLRMQRFGPLLPSPVAERRSLLEHVRASGELLFRHGKAQALHAATLRAFLARLRRRDPLIASLEGDALVVAVAERLSMPISMVRDAMHTPAPHDKAAFRQRIATLSKLRNRL